MPRPLGLPFPVPSPRLSPHLRRRWRRARRSRLAWWLCATAVGVAGAGRLQSATADVQRARVAWGRTVAVAVAVRDLPAGHELRSVDVRVEHWPDAVVAVGTVAPDAVPGRILRTEVVAGEALLGVRLAGEGAGALAARLPTGHDAVGLVPGAAPPLHPGDLVDVVAVVVGVDIDPDGDAAVVAAAALVVDVAADGTVTVAVPHADAPRLARAAAAGPLALTLRPRRG